MKEHKLEATVFSHHNKPTESKQATNKSHSSHSILGGLSGMLMETILHPMDTIRTRMKSNTCEFLSFNQTIHRMYFKEGPKSFFHGFTCTLFGSFIANSTYFYTYETFKHQLRSTGKYPDDLIPFCSAFVGGIFQDFVYIPCDIVRTRMQLGNRQYDYEHVLDGLYKIVKREGPRKLYLGGPAYLTLDLVHTSLTFGFYEFFFKRYRRMFGKKTTDTDIDIRISMITSMTAASISAIFTNPLDVLVTRMQMINTVTEKPMGILSNLKRIYSNEGILGFMKGYTGRVIYYSCAALILFPTYDFLKNAFGVDLSVDEND